MDMCTVAVDLWCRVLVGNSSTVWTSEVQSIVKSGGGYVCGVRSGVGGKRLSCIFNKMYLRRYIYIVFFSSNLLFVNCVNKPTAYSVTWCAQLVNLSNFHNELFLIRPHPQKGAVFFTIYRETIVRIRVTFFI